MRLTHMRHESVLSHDVSVVMQTVLVGMKVYYIHA